MIFSSWMKLLNCNRESKVRYSNIMPATMFECYVITNDVCFIGLNMDVVRVNTSREMELKRGVCDTAVVGVECIRNKLGNNSDISCKKR